MATSETYSQRSKRKEKAPIISEKVWDGAIESINQVLQEGGTAKDVVEAVNAKYGLCAT